MRKVYPGFLQLSAFLNMNLERHIASFRGLFDDLVNDETEKAEATRSFYEEYFAVADLPAEFYLETVQRVFQEYALAQGRAHVARAHGRSGRDPPHRAADHRRRARRHLLARADARGARPVQRLAPVHEDALRPAGRRALRRVQRPALERQHLSGRARRDPRVALSRLRAGALDSGRVPSIIRVPHIYTVLLMPPRKRRPYAHPGTALARSPADARRA